MKFKSRRDLIVNLMIYGGIVVVIAPVFPLLTGGDANAASIAIVLFCLTVAIFLLWMLYGTWYVIDNTHITYQSGPIRGKIEIDTIHTVITGKNLYVGFRPATAHKGVIVKYGKYDEIYFSPKTNENFIAELLKINPQIQIEKYRNG